MATRYEYHNTGEDTYGECYGIYWRGQTFTPSVAHTITSVKQLIYRVGSPGDVTLAIRATSSSYPTGSDLCSATLSGNDFTASTAGSWYEFTFSSGTPLLADTQYAFFISAPSGDTSNKVRQLMDTSTGYSGGSYVISNNSGVAWSGSGTANDLLFEEWGTTGWANIAKVNSAAAVNMSKINTVAVASVAKINSRAV